MATNRRGLGSDHLPPQRSSGRISSRSMNLSPPRMFKPDALPAAGMTSAKCAHRELRVGAGEGAAHEVDDAPRPAAGSGDVAAVQPEVQRRASAAGAGPGGQVYAGAVCGGGGCAAAACRGPPLVLLVLLRCSPES